MRGSLTIIAAAALGAVLLASCSPRVEQAAPAPLDVAALRAAATENGGSIRVIARLAEGDEGQPASADDQAAALAELAASGVATPQALSQTLPLIVAEVTPAQLDAMAASGRYEAVMADELAFPSLQDSGPLVGAPEAWAIGARGAGQAVAILDTGVDAAHPFLRGRVVAEACFSSRAASQGASPVCPNGETTQTGAGAARPCGASGCEHGTHVAGIAAGRGTRFSGMAPDAEIVAIQVFTQFTDSATVAPCRGSGQASPCIASFTSDQIRALDHVRQLSLERPIAAANMSLGGGRSTGACDSDMTKDVIDQLRTAGIATVIASGNNGFPDAVSRPGCISTAVTVGATSKQDQIAPFSNNGPVVDILAPGVNIQSSIPGGRFAAFSGTSMAAPHVAGAFAALRSLSPQASIDDVERALVRSGVAVGSRPRLALFAAARTLRPAPEEASVVEIASNEGALEAAVAEIEALPAGQPVRMMARVRTPQAGTAQAMAQAVTDARAAARAAGIASVETLGAQPILVFEATPAQAAALARSGAISGLQTDAVARPQ